MWEYQNQSTGIANFQTKYFLNAECIVIPNDRILKIFCDNINTFENKSTSNQTINLIRVRDKLLSQLISGKTRLPSSFIEQFESEEELINNKWKSTTKPN